MGPQNVLCIDSGFFFKQLFEENVMENLVLDFLTLYMNHNNFMNFQLHNSIQIFVILTYFVNI